MSVRSSLKPCVHVVPSVGALLRVGAIVSQPVTNPTRTSNAASATNINSAQAYSDIQSSVPDTQALTELDSHADTCCLGPNFAVMHQTGRYCSVKGFSDELAMDEIPIVNAVTVLENHWTGQSNLLVVNQGLFFGDKIKTSLLNPQQLRSNGVIVQDNPFESTETLGITVFNPETRENMFLPMQMRGSFAGFVTRCPTKDEIETYSVKLELTADSDWNPNKIPGLPESQQEGDMIAALTASIFPNVEARGLPRFDVDYVPCSQHWPNPMDAALLDCSSCFEPRTLTERLISSVQVASHLLSVDRIAGPMTT